MPGLMSSIEKSINANVTDMFNFASNILADDIYSYNGENFDGYQWIAALDKKTCLICAELDNQIFDLLPGMQGTGTEPPGVPPIHHNCRCVITPVLKGMREHPTQTAINYKDWFDRQSDEVKLDILGPSRYKEYLNGRAVTEFARDGRILTLAELKISRATRKEVLAAVQRPQAPKTDYTLPLTAEQKNEYKNYLVRQLVGTEGRSEKQINEWADAVMARFDRLPLKLQHLFFENQIAISSQTEPGSRAYFVPITNTIHLHKSRISTSQRSLDTFFHEMGHAIDFRHGTGGSFASALLPLRADFNAFLEKAKRQGGLSPERINQKLRGYSRGDISDLFRGLSKGQFTGTFGHSLDYYRKRGRIQMEAFAHIVSSFQSNSRRHFKEFFPTSFSYFMEWLDKLGT